MLKNISLACVTFQTKPWTVFFFLLQPWTVLVSWMTYDSVFSAMITNNLARKRSMWQCAFHFHDACNFKKKVEKIFMPLFLKQRRLWRDEILKKKVPSDSDKHVILIWTWLRITHAQISLSHDFPGRCKQRSPFVLLFALESVYWSNRSSLWAFSATSDLGQTAPPKPPACRLPFSFSHAEEILSYLILLSWIIFLTFCCR